MKRVLSILIVFALPFGGYVKAQRFRKIITSYAIRLPQAYPTTLIKPFQGNFNPADAPRFDSLLVAYQQSIRQLEGQSPSTKRDTMLMGYLHDQIVVRSFLEMIQPFVPDQLPKSDPKILPLAHQLRKLAVQTKEPYYTWAGYIWEERVLLYSDNIIKAFEVAFERAKLCDDCPSCKQAPECYTALAQYYAEFNDTTSTNLYFNKAFNSVTDTDEKVYTLREWAAVYNLQKNPKKALETIERLYKIDQTPFDETWILRQKALAQVQLKQFDEALLTTQSAINKVVEELSKGSNLDRKTIENSVQGDYRGVLAPIYFGKNEPQKAWEYANSPDFYDELERSPDYILYQIHKALGNDKKALEHHEQFVLFKENQESSNNRNILSIMQRNYEVQKVQNVADNEKLRAENLTKTRTYLLIGLLLLGIILFILWRSNRQKQSTNVLLNHQKQEIDFQRATAEQALVNLKTTQNQLIQKEKMASLGELTAGIAHEIQNPLNFVNNFSELSVDLAQELKEEIEKSPKNPDGGILLSDKEYIEEILGDLSQNQEKINLHGKRASSIIKGMLEHSRIATGERQLTDVNKLADEYLRLAYHGLRSKDKDSDRRAIGYELISDEKLPQINVVPQEIGRVLLNLINNAFYAVNERAKKQEPGYEPKVKVLTQTVDNQLELRVKDNGAGIPDNIQSKIFQPFFTTKPTGEGTGLGLSLAYDIITKGHGGTIEVESVEGEWTTFVVRLPL